MTIHCKRKERFCHRRRLLMCTMRATKQGGGGGARVDFRLFAGALSTAFAVSSLVGRTRCMFASDTARLRRRRGHLLPITDGPREDYVDHRTRGWIVRPYGLGAEDRNREPAARGDGWRRASPRSTELAGRTRTKESQHRKIALICLSIRHRPALPDQEMVGRLHFRRKGDKGEPANEKYPLRKPPAAQRNVTPQM